MWFLAFIKSIKWLGLALKFKSFIIKYWKECLIGAVAFLIYHQNFMETEFLKWVGIRTVPGLEQDISELRQNLTTCELNTVTLKEQIEGTNTQIDQWAHLSHQLQQQHNDLVKEINDMKKKSEQAAKDVLLGPTPETCDAAIEYLKNAAWGDLKWGE